MTTTLDDIIYIFDNPFIKIKYKSIKYYCEKLQVEHSKLERKNEVGNILKELSINDVIEIYELVHEGNHEYVWKGIDISRTKESIETYIKENNPKSLRIYIPPLPYFLSFVQWNLNKNDLLIFGLTMFLSKDKIEMPQNVKNKNNRLVIPCVSIRLNESIRNNKRLQQFLTTNMFHSSLLGGQVRFDLCKNGVFFLMIKIIGKC